ncbi:MAG: diguanylate cyclase [Burkholderiales bacterium]|nr:diguanylate cyclase [Burkholderiales bacterium]
MQTRPDLLPDARALTGLLDGVGAFIFTKDREARFQYANAPLLHFLGLGWEQVQGRHSSELLDMKRSLQIAAHDLRVLELGESVQAEESVGRIGDDRPFVFWTIKHPLRDGDGHICGLIGVSIDITERKALESQLIEQRALLGAVLGHLDAFIYMKDAERRYRFINDKVARDLGLRPEDVIGKIDHEVLPADLAERFWALDREVFNTGQPRSAEETHVGPDGRVRHHWSVKVPVRYEGKAALIGMSTDITELVELREQLRQQAITDGLTGLFNRRHFVEEVQRELARGRRHGHATGLLLIDIDHFKRINDRFGHPQGDAVLRRIADCLRGAIRTEDMAARIGGEEFALLLPRTDLEAARALAERLRGSVAGLDTLVPGGEPVTVSIGVATSEGEERGWDPLYALADARLYAAKQAGRNRVVG